MSVSANSEIKIIGGGIAGLTLAAFLEQQKRTYKLFEQANEFKTVGAGIILGNNAMQVFQQLGIDKQLVKRGNTISALNVVDEQLNVLSGISLNDFEQKYGISNIAIHRTDLHEVLLNVVDTNAIHLSKQLSHIVNKELQFTDGTVESYDQLIGADGIHSKVRQAVFADQQIKEAKQLCWRGICEFQLPALYIHQFNEAWGKGARFGFGQINEQQVYWFALTNYVQSSNEWKDKPWKKSFEYFHPLVNELLHVTEEEKIHVGEITQLETMKQWYKNDICLIGDACHAMTPNMGQGAGQSIEDAFTLSDCFQHSDPDNVFADFQKRRQKKVNFIVNNSWKIGSIAQLESDWQRRIRNKLMRWTPDFIAKKQTARIFKLSA